MPAFAKKLIGAAVLLLPAAVILIFVGLQTEHLAQTGDPYAERSVLITELMAKNLSGLTDRDGDHSDWIELYNAGDAELDLTGWALSDKKSQPNRWVFPSVTLPAHGYLVVYASGKSASSGSELHTNFRLSAEGETLTLTDPNGRVADRLSYPAQKWDIPYGRLQANPDEAGYFSAATPGSANPSLFLTTAAEGVDSSLCTVDFSAEGGFYTAAFPLTLSCDDPDALILYTTDGSAPKIGSAVYTQPLTVIPETETRWASLPFSPLYKNWLYDFGTGTIAKCRVIRAAVYKDGRLSPTVTNTYFINPETTLPVLSLVTDPDGLFGNAEGVSVPGAISHLVQKYSDRELAFEYSNSSLNTKLDGNLELYGTDGRLLLNAANRFSVCGGASRLYSPTKSLRVRLEDADYTFTVGDTSYTLSTFDLRSPRTDEYRSLVYRDAFGENLLLGLDMGTQAGTPVQLYLDGEFWGVYYLKETKKAALYQSRFGLDADNLECVKLCQSLSVDYAENEPEEDEETESAVIYDAPGEGVSTAYGSDALTAEILDLYAYLQTADLSDDAGYAWAEERFDLEDFAKYMAAGIYMNSTDWVSRGNNIRLWRSSTVDPENPYADHRWRCLMFDLDNTLVSAHSQTLEEHLTKEADPNDPTRLVLLFFQKIWQNERFRLLFADEMHTLMDTVFNPDTLLPAWQAHIETLRPEAERMLQRVCIRQSTSLPARLWFTYVEPFNNMTGDLQEYTLDEWEAAADSVSEFIRERPACMTEFLDAALAQAG